MNRFHQLLIPISILAFISCKNNKQNAEPEKMDWYDSIPFGTIQPQLEQNAKGEKIIRIDSLVHCNIFNTTYYLTCMQQSTFTIINC